MDRHFVDNYPIILGLFGEAGTGKTVTAQGLAPTSRLITGDESGLYWEHLYFAMPLYAMANAKQTMTGDLGFDRICYEIHSVLVQAFGNSPLYGAPAYTELVEMVLELAEYPVPQEGKARDFLQYAGTEVCRGHDPDCWVNWMKQKINREYDGWKKENLPLNFKYALDDVDNGDGTFHDDLDENVLKYAVALSDCRFPNEANFINSMPNGLLVRLTADSSVLRERIYDRDGVVMNTAQMAHSSETALQQIPMDMFDLVLDTSNLSVQEQIQEVLNLVNTYTGVTCPE